MRFFKDKTIGEKIVFSIVFIIFLLFAFSYVYLVFWCFISGMRNNTAIATNPFAFDGFQIRNYVDVFSLLKVQKNTFLDMFFNSVCFAFLGPLMGIFVTAMMAYVTSKYKFFGANAVYFAVLIVITLPIYGSQSAMYKLLYNIGFLNTRLMMLTSLDGFTIYYLYFYAFFKGLSWSYAEAASIDGANDWQIYFRIMFPQSIAMVGSVFIISWITEWNSYATALLYLNKLPPLSVGIYLFKMQMEYSSRMDILYAACFISILPPLVMFAIFNNALMSNVSLGGIKE